MTPSAGDTIKVVQDDGAEIKGVGHGVVVSVGEFVKAKFKDGSIGTFLHHNVVVVEAAVSG